MQKKKNSIHIAGIGTLLKLLMYEDFCNYKFKYYLIKNNAEEKAEKKDINFRYLKNLEFEKKNVISYKKKI